MSPLELFIAALTPTLETLGRDGLVILLVAYLGVQLTDTVGDLLDDRRRR